MQPPHNISWTLRTRTRTQIGITLDAHARRGSTRPQVLSAMNTLNTGSANIQHKKYRQSSSSLVILQNFATGLHPPRNVSLINAHSHRLPAVLPFSPGLCTLESYFTVYASYLITYPRLKPRATTVFEKTVDKS